MKNRRNLERRGQAQYARDLFAELREGMKALAQERLGNRKLRTNSLKKPDEPSMEEHNGKSFERG